MVNAGQRSWHPSHLDKRALFLLVFVGTFLAGRIAGILPGYALDDYQTGLHTTLDLNAQLLSQGRYTFAALNWVIAKSELQQTDFSGLGFILLLVSSALFSWSCYRKLLETSTTSWVAGIGALLASHPYLTEYVTFRQALFPMGLMFLGCYASVSSYASLARSDQIAWPALAFGLAAAVLAVGLNQLALPLICIGVAFNELAEIVGKDIGTKQTARRLFRAALRVLACAALLAVLYALFSGLAKLGYGEIVTNNRAALLDPSQLSTRATQVGKLIGDVFASSDTLVPAFSKIGMGLAIAALIAIPALSKRWRLLVVALTFLVVATALSIAPISIGSVWWPVPRTLIGIPFALAGMLTILANSPVHRRLASLAVIPLAVSVVLFTGLNQSTLLDQQRLNRWDISKAQLITATVLQRFPEARHGKIVVAGGAWNYPVAPSMAKGDMNLSALSIGWSIDSLFEEATGYALDVSAPQAGEEPCRGLPSFPSEASMFEKDGQTIVCL